MFYYGFVKISNILLHKNMLQRDIPLMLVLELLQ